MDDTSRIMFITIISNAVFTFIILTHLNKIKDKLNKTNNYMGQAKQRGTFEQRKQQAIDKNKAIAEQLAKLFPAIETTSKPKLVLTNRSTLMATVAMLATLPIINEK